MTPTTHPIPPGHRIVISDDGQSYTIEPKPFEAPRAKYGEQYCFITASGVVGVAREDGDRADDSIHAFGNYHMSSELAEAAVPVIRATHHAIHQYGPEAVMAALAGVGKVDEPDGEWTPRETGEVRKWTDQFGQDHWRVDAPPCTTWIPAVACASTIGDPGAFEIGCEHHLICSGCGQTIEAVQTTTTGTTLTIRLAPHVCPAYQPMQPCGACHGQPRIPACEWCQGTGDER